MRRLVVYAVSFLLMLTALPVASAAPGSHNKVTILRDDYGVAHLYALDLDALFFGAGYSSAQDRLWQAEILRRSARGTLAELLGESALEGDIQARTFFGPPDRVQAMYDEAGAETRRILDAYAEGVNAWIETATGEGTLPVEFGGVAPAPWHPTDSLAIFLLLGAQFGQFGADELTYVQQFAALTERLGPTDGALAFGDTHWLDDPDAPTSVPAAGAVNRPRRGHGPPARIDPKWLTAGTELDAIESRVKAARRMAGIDVEGHNSNAAVIAPSLSADRSALLLGGPQMGYTTPQINHEIGLHGAGFDVTGMIIAGGPLVPIGVGRGYAWTLTSGGSDNTDIYAEVLNDAGQYLFDGTWHDLDCRVETIAVASSGNVSHPVCATGHGPIIFQDGSTAFSVKSSVTGREVESLEAWMGLGRVRGLRGFAAQLPGLAYNFNILYADRAGNIAYWHIGKLPIRPDGVNPFFPLPGTGEAEWQGDLPFSQMPHALNPDQGWLTSWNNKPAPGWSNSSADFWMWGGAHRVNTFIAELEKVGRAHATTATLEALNRTGGWTTDTPTGQASSVFVSSYLDDLLGAVDAGADPRLAGVVGEMQRWDRLQVDLDGDGFYDRPWGTIFNAWWQALADGVFGDELGGITDRFVLGNLIDRLLKGPSAGLPLQLDYLDGATVGEAVTDALVLALDGLAAEQGSGDPDDWRQPISTITWSPIGAGTVPDTLWMNRGTYNQIVHLGPKGRLWAQNVIAPGQSGDLRSPHFADQLPLYATWTYKPMRLTRRDLAGHIESTVRLVVP